MKCMLLFTQDLSIFGSSVQSWATDRDPTVQIDFGEFGVTLTRIRGDHVQVERVPWALCKATEHWTLEEFYGRHPEKRPAPVKLEAPRASGEKK